MNNVINEDLPSEVVSKATETTQDNNKIQPEEENKQENKVFHKKDGRLHIYVIQDKYKGEQNRKIGWEDYILMENRKYLWYSKFRRGYTNIREMV